MSQENLTKVSTKKVTHDGREYTILLQEVIVEAKPDFIKFKYENDVIREEFSCELPLDLELFARFNEAFQFLKSMLYHSCEYNIDIRKGLEKYNVSGTSLTLSDRHEPINTNAEYFHFLFKDQITGFETYFVSNNSHGLDHFAIHKHDYICACPVFARIHEFYKNGNYAGTISIK